MGKVALLFVAGVFAAAAFMMNSQKATSVKAKNKQSAYQEAILAHQTAESGLQMAMSKAKRDFDAWRTGYDDTGFDGGNFDVAVEGTAAGPIQLTATGTFDGAQHQIRAKLARLAPSPAALLIDADTVEATLSNDYIISGRDTRPGSGVQSVREGNGSGDYTNGVWTRGTEGHSAFLGAAYHADPARVRGTGGETDIIQGSADDIDLFPIPLGLLYGEAITRADYAFSDGTVFYNDTFGAPGDPKIVVVDGSAVSLGTTRGYGLLIVKGSFFMHDDFEWEGLVLAHRQEGDMDVTMTGNASIYGALIGRHGYITGSDEGEEEEEGGEGGCNCEEESGTPPPSGPPTGSHPDPDKNNKVLICHVPPGNPENAHTISISVNALHTHLTHHDDYDGPCLEDTGGGGSEEGGTCTESENTETGGSAGRLRFNMRNDTGIFYSTEAIGKLAARLPVVKQASWIIKFDQIGEDLANESSNY